MKKENFIDMENDVEMYKKRLRELEPYIEDDEAMAVLYNQALVDKAVCLHRLEEQKKDKKPFCEFKKFFNFGRRQKKICDYFMK